MGRMDGGRGRRGWGTKPQPPHGVIFSFGFSLSLLACADKSERIWMVLVSGGGGGGVGEYSWLHCIIRVVDFLDRVREWPTSRGG